ncbi:hypothetical protein PBI_LUCKY2013_153 [Mycobacterium phage Lucky2013]|uniref:hypothetical protein n=1 Tax=Mycobacterium phage MiaZeal TaxID=1567005 RepID=UPI000541283C|nr:hypothetical protein AVV70_gp160 [Mycobacterium phage MiaZeal]AIY32514.1 hypothetical protein PBI_MIAZEAL_160 [Mycobacterium phage MiaZeal]ASD50775.1 hypothetical protein PORCELAIN_157 [Mycobacterium phage Porcelain]ASD53546.1 hypothetical protein PBI_LUCKY2013_153 [Mycobacterium phage Lucky2013]
MTQALKTRGAINRIQPRATKEQVEGTPLYAEANLYEVGAVILDANGVAWQRDIENLTTEYLNLDRGKTYWWKVGSDDDSLTSMDIPLPAVLLSPGVNSD